MQERWTDRVLAVVACWAAANGAHAGVTTFTDKDQWTAAVGNFTTIDFTGFQSGTFITDQYAELGVLLTDGDDFVEGSDPVIFPNDGWGMNGIHDITVVFDSPQRYIAVDYPGFIRFELFQQGTLINTITFPGFGGFGNFAGLISLEPFDSAVLIDWIGIAAEIDDLHFGVPAPPALALMGLGALCQLRRRRQALHGAWDPACRGVLFVTGRRTLPPERCGPAP